MVDVAGKEEFNELKAAVEILAAKVDSITVGGLELSEEEKAAISTIVALIMRMVG